MNIFGKVNKIGARWKNRARLPKFKDMPAWAQGVFCAIGGIESAYWWSKVREISPLVENIANHSFLSFSTFGSAVVLGLLALQATYFTGMAIQCGKYLQEQVFA